MMRRYFAFILRHRLAVVLLCLGLTGLAAFSLSRAVVATSLVRLFLGENPALDKYLERVREFGSDEVIVLGFDHDDLLSPDWIRRMEGAVETLEEHERIARVRGVTSARHIHRTADGALSVRPYIEEAIDDPSQTAVLAKKMVEDRFVGGLAVTPDGLHSAMIIELVVDPDRAAEEGPKILEEVLTAFERQGIPRDTIHQTGQLVGMAELLNQTTYNIERLLPIVSLMLLGVVWLMFHRLWPALVSLGIAALAVFWTLGFAVQVDRELNILMAVVPSIILVVAFSDVVHLCSAYLVELGHGHPKNEAILNAAEDVGRACWYTSITTFVGFISLCFVPTPVLRLFGISLAVGVAVALLLAMTLLPILFSVMPEPKPLRDGATVGVQRALDSLMQATKTFARRYPWPIIAFSGVVIVVATIGTTKVTIETDNMARLDAENPIRKDRAWFRQSFRGTNVIDVFVDAKKGDLLDPANFNKLAAFQRALEADDAVGSTLSFVDLMHQLHHTLNPELTDETALPDSREMLAQYVLLFDMRVGRELLTLVDFDRRSTRLRLRLKPDAFRATYYAGERARALAREHLGQDLAFEVTGLTYLIGDWLGHLIEGQRRALGFSLLLIAGIMMIAFRSIKVGLLSMVPNLLPLLCLGGWLGWTWDTVDSDVFIVALMAIGIGVDDTIHFLARYRTEALRVGSEAAVERTFDFAGRAILMTTLILVAGFLPFATSDYLSISMTGTLLPMCLLVAVFADLLLVPAMVHVGWISFQKPRG